MKRTSSLNDLLIEGMTDLFNAKSQMTEALPKMAEASQSSALKAALEDFHEISKEHLDRLQGIFSKIGHHPQGGICRVMKNIITEATVMIDTTPRGPARDVTIISAAQRGEQYEIAGYQVACDHASDLRNTKIVGMLYKILDEERAMNFHLNELAQKMINAQAIKPEGGFYIPEGRFKGMKRKPKNTDVTRFIDEGNPNIQEPRENQEKKEENGPKNPEEEGDLS